MTEVHKDIEGSKLSSLNGSFVLSYEPAAAHVASLDDPDVAEANSTSPQTEGTANAVVSEQDVVIDMHAAVIGYLGVYMSFGALGPYYSLFLAEKGFTSDQIGYITAVSPLVNLLLLSPLTYLVDRFHCAKLMLFGSMILGTVPTFLMTIMTSKQQPMIIILLVISYIALVPLSPLLDRHTLSMLPMSRKTEWGRMRAYGAYGWGIGALLSSILIDRLGWPVAALQSALGLLGGVYCVTYGKPYEEVPPTSMNYREVLGYVTRYRKLLLFWVIMCIMGMGYCLIGTFLFVFLSEIGTTSRILYGLTIIITVVTEIPMFQHSKWIHKRFSDKQLVGCSQAVWSFRVIMYSLLQNPWFVLFLEPLHGFTFGLTWLSGVHMMNKSFPPELSASAIGLLGTAIFGVGPMLGNVIGGKLYSLCGPRWMFRIAAMFMAVSTIGFFTLDYFTEEIPEIVHTKVTDCVVLAEEEEENKKDGEVTTDRNEMHALNSHKKRSGVAEEKRKYVNEGEAEELLTV